MPPTAIDLAGVEVRRVLADFAAVAVRCGAPYLLVGAAARLLAAACGMLDERTVRDMRATMDLDFGVQFGSWHSFERFHSHLADHFSPRNQGEQIHFLHKATGIKADVIPFGPIAPDGRLPIPSRNSAFNVLGFAEALERALALPVAQGLQVPVAHDPGFVLLKIIAFGDRKEPRDLQDAMQVMRNYDTTMNTQRYFIEFAEEFAAEELDYEHAKYVLLGLDIGRMASAPSNARFCGILSGLAEQDNLALAHVVDRRLPLSRPGTTGDAAREFSLLLQGARKGFRDSRPHLAPPSGRFPPGPANKAP